MGLVYRGNPINWKVPPFDTELLIISTEHLDSPLLFCAVCVSQSSVLYVVFCRSWFGLYLLAIVLSVFLLYIASDFHLWCSETFLDNLCYLWVLILITYKTYITYLIIYLLLINFFFVSRNMST